MRLLAARCATPPCTSGPDASGVKLGDIRLAKRRIGCGDRAACRRNEEDLCVKPGLLGLNGGAINLPTPCLPMHTLSPRGSYKGSHTEMAELLALVHPNGLPPVPSPPARWTQ